MWLVFPTEGHWDNVTVNCNSYAKMTQLQCLKSSRLKREAADDGFSENAPSRYIYVKVASFFPYFSLWLQFHFLNTFLLSSPKYFHYAWEVQGTPMERNSLLLFFQTIRGPARNGPQSWKVTLSHQHRTRSRSEFDHWRNKASLLFHTPRVFTERTFAAYSSLPEILFLVP